MPVTVKGIENDYTITLCKVNGTPIGELMIDCLKSMSVTLGECDEIELKVYKYYYSQIDKIKHEFYYYDLIKSERIIALNNKQYVIKTIKEDDKNKVKTITAYSKEKKLEKNTISLEDVGFYLKDSDDELGIYNLDEYMYEETGWRFGHIDDKVRYNDNGEPRMRWIESIDNDWYSYLNDTLAEQFNCITIFNNENNTVNLYDIDEFGDDLKIMVSYDNYLKELATTHNSSDIVTKLKLIGNEEYCFIEDANPTGLKYIENYSYFIESRDMSDKLIEALELYDRMCAERTITWKELNAQISTKSEELRIKKNDEYMTLENYKATKNQLDYYLSMANTSKDPLGTYAQLAVTTAEQLKEIKEQRGILSEEIRILEEDLANLNESIKLINILCRKPTATDSNGNLIFNQALLDELKEFIYMDTYTDDAFYDAEEMLKVGKRKLELECKPTIEWDVDVLDFTKRLISNKNRQQWNGVLGLGDLVGFYDLDTHNETFVYVVGYQKDYENQTLSLTLSNKKGSSNAFKVVNDLLKTGKLVNKQLTINRRVFNLVKGNRINMTREEVL